MKTYRRQFFRVFEETLLMRSHLFFCLYSQHSINCMYSVLFSVSVLHMLVSYIKLLCWCNCVTIVYDNILILVMFAAVCDIVKSINYSIILPFSILSVL